MDEMTEVSSRNGEDHASQVQKVLESIQAFQRDDDDSTSLRPEAQVFLETAHKYLECRKRMDAKFESLPNAKVLEDFVLTTGFDDDDRQQSILGATAQTLEEVYQAATAMKPLFEETVNGIVDQILNKIPPEGSSSIDIQFAPLKGRQRALEKAQNEYHDKDPGPDVAWLSDIVRGSVVFETVDQIILCLELIRDSEDIQIVKAKNRFRFPSLTGYRDVNLKFRLPSGNFQHICELQIHHKDLKRICKEMKSHESYEYFRSYYAGETETLEESLEDLKHIAGGTALDLSFVLELLETSADERRLERLGELFEVKLCEYQLALKVYAKLLEIQLGKHGALHESIGATYLKIATVLRKQGKEEDAITVFDESLDVFCKTIGEDCLPVATVCIKLAHSVQRQGKLDEALELYKRALQIYKKTLGLFHPDSANTFHSMATVLKQQDKLDEATDLLLQSLEIFRTTCGDDVLQASYAYNTLGTIYEKQEKLKDAMELYEKSLRIKRGVAGKSHPYVSFTLNCIANLLRKQGDSERALATYQESLDSYYQSVGEDHPLVGFTCTNIANILYDQGKIAESKEYFDKTLALYLKLYGTDHPKVAKVKEEMKKLDPP